MDHHRDLRRFEELLDRCERTGRQRLAFDDLRDLGRLYRLHAAELARIRDRDDDPEAVRHLNALCVRAHTALHARPPRPRAPGSGRAALADALARTWRYQAAAWALLLTGALVGGLLVRADPSRLPALVPSGLGYTEASAEELATSPAARARFLERSETPAGQNALFGSVLFAHNLRVGLLSFATGILAGIPTVLLQLYNGVVVGGFAAAFLQDGTRLAFLAWILPHGVPEFSAITLCAAAGLLLGDAVAAPGRRGRRRALREAMEPALVLVGLAVPLLFLAAGMESFVRESELGTALRLAVASAETLLLLAGLAGIRALARRRGLDRSWLAELAGGRGADAARPSG